MGLLLTPQQTIGPFFHRALLRDNANDLAAQGAPGLRIVVEGRVLDGDGNPVSDAMVEIWQADSAGRYDHPDDTRRPPRAERFHGFGRTGTNSEGHFHFVTVKPAISFTRHTSM